MVIIDPGERISADSREFTGQNPGLFHYGQKSTSKNNNVKNILVGTHNHRVN